MMKKRSFFCWLSALVVSGCSASRPANLGVINGMLAPCPSAPHCVSSQGENESRRMDPIPYATSKTEARDKLLTILRSMKRTTIVSIEDDYLYAECRSALFRYVDDVEFFFDDDKKLIHFRSSSRLGYYDMGVNRRRMEKIREKFIGN